MAEELKFIVNALGKEPFLMKNIQSMVDLDEKNPRELLRILHEVMGSMDEDYQSHVREIGVTLQLDDIVHQILEWLTLLKYPKAPQDEKEYEEWLSDLGTGNKSSVYSILYWVLSSYEKLSRRIYLSKFLLPIQPPPDIMIQADSNLVSLLNEYNRLQEEFKIIHKDYENVKFSHSTTGRSIKAEFAQLQDERRQLINQIEDFKSMKHDYSTFDAVFALTSERRQLEEELLHFQGQLRNQKQSSHRAQYLFGVLQKRLHNLNNILNVERSSPSEILGLLKDDIKYLKSSMRETLVSEKNRLEDEVLTLEVRCQKPVRTLHEVQKLKEKLKDVEDKTNSTREKVTKTCQNSGNNLVNFRQHLLLAKSKYAEKFGEVQHVSNHMLTLKSKLDKLMLTKESELKDSVERDHYERRLQYEKATKHVNALEDEVNILKKTELILKERLNNIKNVLTNQEIKSGVPGFRKAQVMLEEISEQTADADEIKGQTLEEISVIINQMNSQIQHKKETLKPKMVKLKDVRRLFHELEHEFNEKKIRYDKITSSIITENKQLQQEFEQVQDRWLALETQYYELLCSQEIMEISLQKVLDEERYNTGDVSFLPDFPTRCDFYKSKIGQQEKLAKELRKNLRDIENKESGGAEQKNMFRCLHKLLMCKFDSTTLEGQKCPNLTVNEVQVVGGAEILMI